MIPSGAAHNEMILADMDDMGVSEAGRFWSEMHDTKVKLSDEIERHTLTVLVDNEAGVLARVVGLFSAAATISKV